MDIRSLIAFLGRRGWILIVGALVAGTTTYLITRGLEPVYEAKASILVINQVAEPTTGDPAVVNQLNDIQISDRLMKTYVELVARPVILEVVSQRLDGIYSSTTLADKVTVSNAPVDTQILKISVKDSDPALAASIANLTAEAFIEENEREIARPGTVSISQTAVPPTSPVEPKVGLYTAVAVFLGFVVAAVYARALEYLDDTVKIPDDIAATLDLPTLGVIGRVGAGGLTRAVRRISGRGDLSPFLEDVRELRTRIHFLKLESALQSIAVVSQNPDEGKTTTAASLAEVLAEAGDQVILVDANLRRPRLHDIYGVANSFGLTGFLMQQDTENVTLVPTRVSNLRLLPSGPSPLSPSELLTSRKMRQLVASLKEEADYVIFDTAPLASASDALIVASMVEGTIAVIQAGRTRSQEFLQTIRRFDEARARVLGVVLNKAKSSGRQYRYGATPATSWPTEPAPAVRPRRAGRPNRRPRKNVSIPPSENA